MFNSPNTAAMMGTVPPHRRGIAAGARVLVQNTGAVISIAFVLAVVTSSVPKIGPVRGLLRPRPPHLQRPAVPVHRRTCTRRCGACPPISLLGAFVAAARPSHAAARGDRSSRALATSRRRPRTAEVSERDRDGSQAAADRRGRRADRHDAADDPLLRGDRAAARRRRPRPGPASLLHARPTSSGCARSSGCATCWDCRSSSSSQLLEAETARAELRREFEQTEDPAGPARILEQALGHIGTQLELVRSAARARAARGGARGQAAPDPQAPDLPIDSLRAAAGASRYVERRWSAPGVDRRAMAALSLGPSVHRHRAGLDPGAAAVPDRRGSPQLRRGVGARARGDDLELGDPAAVRPRLRPRVAAVADAARAGARRPRASRWPASPPATG